MWIISSATFGRPALISLVDERPYYGKRREHTKFEWRAAPSYIPMIMHYQS